MSKTNARSKKIAYYATNKSGTFIEVSIGYQKGMNYFTYETYNGYKLAFQPMEMKDHGYGISSTYMLFSGLGLKVETAERFNAKRMAYLAATAPSLDAYAEVLAAVAAKHDLAVGEKLTAQEAYARVAEPAEAAAP